MTPAEARKFAAEIPDGERMSHARATREVLQMVLHEAPNSTKRKVLNSLLESAEAYQRTSQPGHTVWYSHYLQLAALAAEAFGPKGSDAVLY